MIDLVFVTGNQKKADYLARWLNIDVPHQKLNLEEIQSLDLPKVAEYKVREAYRRLKKPVLVEDISLSFDGMGRLPGTLVKWFIEEIGIDGLCDLASNLKTQSAKASIIYALFDGKDLKMFEGETQGHIVLKPRGSSFGWNPIFIPNGHTKTYAEMSEEEFMTCSHRGIAMKKLEFFLRNTQH